MFASTTANSEVSSKVAFITAKAKFSSKLVFIPSKAEVSSKLANRVLHGPLDYLISLILLVLEFNVTV